MSGVRGFFASMTGRLFVILVVGICAAALVAAQIASTLSERAFERELLGRNAAFLQSYVQLLNATQGSVRATLLANPGPVIRMQSTAPQGRTDEKFEQALAALGGALANAKAYVGDPRTCMRDFLAGPSVLEALSTVPRSKISPPPPLPDDVVLPVCRLITLTLSDGTRLHLKLATPPVQREPSRLLQPAFLALLVLATSVLSYVAAHLASSPLNRMSVAAQELGEDLHRDSIAVRGPTEVRRAAEALNAMQRRLQQHIAERTEMLASIAHDLKTPLTRLRLRLEKVEEKALRSSLIADAFAMQALVEEGLELARSAETSELRVMLELDSLLESLVEDAIDAGSKAAFDAGCGAILKVRPLAVMRLFSNLIDNALKYGGSVAVSCAQENGDICVRVRDRGPGLPEHRLEDVFKPFVRLEESRSRESGGTGLGLTIARMLAERNGATLQLRNHPEGGLEAIVRWSAQSGVLVHESV